jgi:predicted enzyme related to lactoylglutathione lyase
VQHTIVWFDIPVSNMDRAIRFYEAVTETKLRRLPLPTGEETALFEPRGEGGVTGCLFSSTHDKPSEWGSRVYFNAEPSIDAWLERVEQAGGRIVVGKTEISPELGFFAYFIDSEGNRVGLNAKG